MTRLVDIRPFPWSRPDAQKLHETLAHSFPGKHEAVALARESGLDPGRLTSDSAVRPLWGEIIDYAVRKGVLEQLLSRARAKYPNGPLAAVVDAALTCTKSGAPMASLIKSYPFAFDQPMGQELLRHLAAQFSGEREAWAFVEQHGIQPLNLTPGLSALNRWHEILQQAAIAGVTGALVQAARDLQPRNPRVAFLDALLAEKESPVSAAPSKERDGLNFITGTDTVNQHEALLFFDDLTIPAGHVPKLLRTLELVTSYVSAVCLLRVQNGLGSFFGTGFRIGADLILTNEHVLFPKRKKAIKVFADFGFDVDQEDLPLQVVALPGDVGSIVGNAAHDWGVIRVANLDASWPILKLDGGSAPQEGDAAYILQHPAGQRKRLGFVRNTITNADDKVVHYLTDTQPGSSGAPVFDALGKLIALHHAGGEPIEVAGHPPLVKNEGIRIERVLEDLKQAGLLG